MPAANNFFLKTQQIVLGTREYSNISSLYGRSDNSLVTSLKILYHYLSIVTFVSKYNQEMPVECWNISLVT